MAADDDDFDRHVRRVDPDRWLSARLVQDEPARGELLALYALDEALAAVAPAVTQPALGEIRFAWWREQLEAARRDGESRSHPAISALAPALKAGRLRMDLLEALVGARHADLEPEPFADDATLEAWLDGVSGTVMGLAARLLEPAAVDAGPFVHAGRAWGWWTLLRSADSWRARGRRPWPVTWGDDPPEVVPRVHKRMEDALAAAKGELQGLPTAAFPACAHATLVRDYAKGRSPSELAKRARLVWASARGRV